MASWGSEQLVSQPLLPASQPVCVHCSHSKALLQALILTQACCVCCGTCLQSRGGKGRRGGDVHPHPDKHAGDKGAGQQQGRPPRGPALGPRHGFYGSSLPKRCVCWAGCEGPLQPVLCAVLMAPGLSSRPSRWSSDPLNAIGALNPQAAIGLCPCSCPVLLTLSAPACLPACLPSRLPCCPYLAQGRHVAWRCWQRGSVWRHLWRVAPQQPRGLADGGHTPRDERPLRQQPTVRGQRRQRRQAGRLPGHLATHGTRRWV